MSVMHFQYPGKSAPGLKSALGRLASKFCAVAGGALLLLGGAAATAPVSAQTACQPKVFTLWAGKTIDVGTLTVTNDATHIYVKYDLTMAGATLDKVHLWVGNDLTNLDGGGTSRPSPGQMPFHGDAQGGTTYTFSIPFEDLPLVDIAPVCPFANSLYVVAHAEVNVPKVGGGSKAETAFGGDMPGKGNAWWYLGEYTVCCNFTDPPTTLSCTTAFAKGSHVFASDPRANPAPSLPSLALIRNRWGWAHEFALTESSFKLPIHAGAGLNRISNKTLVGELVVTVSANPLGQWTVTVKYKLDPGKWLSEVHVYAADESPTTTAPGLYGFGDHFTPKVSFFEKTFSVSDTNGDGRAWLIAHAVVCR